MTKAHNYGSPFPALNKKKVYIMQFWEKKSELWNKKSQLPFYFFIQWWKRASIHNRINKPSANIKLKYKMKAN